MKRSGTAIGAALAALLAAGIAKASRSSTAFEISTHEPFTSKTSTTPLPVVSRFAFNPYTGVLTQSNYREVLPPYFYVSARLNDLNISKARFDPVATSIGLSSLAASAYFFSKHDENGKRNGILFSIPGIYAIGHILKAFGNGTLSERVESANQIVDIYNQMAADYNARLGRRPRLAAQNTNHQVQPQLAQSPETANETANDDAGSEPVTLDQRLDLLLYTMQTTTLSEYTNNDLVKSWGVLYARVRRMKTGRTKLTEKRLFQYEKEFGQLMVQAEEAESEGFSRETELESILQANEGLPKPQRDKNYAELTGTFKSCVATGNYVPFDSLCKKKETELEKAGIKTELQ